MPIFFTVGLEVLLTLTADSTPFAVREAALKVMRCYVGDGQASPSITGSKSRLRRRPKRLVAQR